MMVSSVVMVPGLVWTAEAPPGHLVTWAHSSQVSGSREADTGADRKYSGRMSDHNTINMRVNKNNRVEYLETGQTLCQSHYSV